MNKLKILSDLKKIEQNINKSNQQNIIISEDYNISIDNKRYIATNTFKSMHSNNDFIRLVMGAYGSGKSSGMCAEIVLRACTMPTCFDNIRRSKWVIVRNTSGELETTTLQTWLHWFGDLGTVVSHKKPVLSVKHVFNDGKGRVELELLFLALDRIDDIKKIKSLEITGAYLNELSELPQAILSHIKSRLGRFPSDMMIDKPYWSGIIADTNPPDADGWIYKMFEVDRPLGYHIFKQPAALFEDESGKYITNKDADNIDHLPTNYYVDMARGETKEFVRVYCMGEYGTVILGRKVYENYNDDLHTISNIESEHNEQLLLGWDFGLTPACIIAQRCKNGQIKVLKEFCTSYLSVRELAENTVYPYLISYYKDFDYISVGDPSDRKSDSTGVSCMQVLDECGIHTTKALTNDIQRRIDKPALIISKEGCPTLRKGFLGRYNYKRVRVLNEEKYHDVPDKTHPYSDIQDCIQYVCLNYCFNDRLSSKIDDSFYEQAPQWC